MGFCTTSDFQEDSLAAAVHRAVDLAREAAEDPHNGLAEAEAGTLVAGSELELFDPAIAELDAETKIGWAHELERAARAADPRVTRFRDSGVASGEQDSVLVTSNGAVRAVHSTGIALWCNPIAEQDGELQTEVWYDSKTHVGDLEPVESIGRTAGVRAARMLGAKPVKTQNVPVIFEPAMAAGLVSGMLGALDGDMVYKKASFLADKLGETIAAPGLTVVDDPLLVRGSGSSPFDGEGLATARKAVVDQGRLTTFLYDSYTARKAGVPATSNARRGTGSLPYAGPFNFFVEAGTDDPDEILRSADRALLLTRGLGRGLNTVSGEYSRGANGLWIEKGEVVHPVQEVTIAGDYLGMLAAIDRVGTDLMMRGATGAPTLRIAEMTVSGS
jgi:PmbA protein